MTTTTTDHGIENVRALRTASRDGAGQIAGLERGTKPLVIQAAPDLQIVYTDPSEPAIDLANLPTEPTTPGLDEAAKRAFDIVVALVALTLTLPVWIVVALVTLIERRGPALYAQERIGRHGRMFRCWKFRTMYPNADEVLHEVLDSDPVLAQEWAEDHKLTRDPRVTPIGRILRRFDLDEIPQFINILRGDMSVVGPRPVVLAEAPKFGELLPVVLSVRPGLTGLWQVSGRNEMTYRERVEREAAYVQTRSFQGDVSICFRTPVTLLQRNGER